MDNASTLNSTLYRMHRLFPKNKSSSWPLSVFDSPRRDLRPMQSYLCLISLWDPTALPNQEMYSESRSPCLWYSLPVIDGSSRLRSAVAAESCYVLYKYKYIQHMYTIISYICTPYIILMPAAISGSLGCSRINSRNHELYLSGAKHAVC